MSLVCVMTQVESGAKSGTQGVSMYLLPWPDCLLYMNLCS